MKRLTGNSILIAILLFVLITSAGCQRMHVDVRVLSHDGEPLRGIKARAESGPYFADVRGLVGAFDAESITDENGEATFSLAKGADCWVVLQVTPDQAWAVSNQQTEHTISSQWVMIPPEPRFAGTENAPTETPQVWMRVRNHELRGRYPIR